MLPPKVMTGLATAPTDLGLVAMLRLRTRPQHDALDSGMKIGRSDATVDDYIAFLRASLAIVTSFEHALDALDGCAIAKRSDRIASDLEALGAASHVESAAIWVPTSTAEGRGCAYVIEGSALGGIMLAKRVRQLELDERTTSYLRFRGAETKAHWVAFMAELDAWGASASPRDRDIACEAAANTFDAYAAVFERAGAKTTTAAEGAMTS